MKAANAVSSSTDHFFNISDKISKLSSLVDTGAEASTVPRTAVKGHLQPIASYIRLTTTNNSQITTYGQFDMALDIGLKRRFKWPFIVTDIKQPIIGADFCRNTP